MSLHLRALPRRELELQAPVIDELAREAIAHGEDVIRLIDGISDLPAPPAVIEAIAGGARDRTLESRVIPEGLPELRDAIAQHYREVYQVSAAPERVLVGAGAGALLRQLLALVCDPGEEVLIPRPANPLYRAEALLAGARVTTYDVELYTHRVDMDSFRRAFHPDRTALVVISTPGDPLGNVVEPNEILDMYRTIAGSAFVLVDEILDSSCFYRPFVPALAYLPEDARDHTVVLNGFSRGFRMAAKRLGWMVVPEQLLLPMRLVFEHARLACDPVTQRAAIAALADRDAPRELVRAHRDRAEYACERLALAPCAPVHPDAGFFLTLDCAAWLDARDQSDTVLLARDLVRDARVAVVPGSDFGLPRTLRLSLCSERFTEAIDRLYDHFARAPLPSPDDRPARIQGVTT